ncbi:hypothetical protein HDU67_006917, partial [Dinochytrium kinnereticum]
MPTNTSSNDGHQQQLEKIARIPGLSPYLAALDRILQPSPSPPTIVTKSKTRNGRQTPITSDGGKPGYASSVQSPPRSNDQITGQFNGHFRSQVQTQIPPSKLPQPSKNTGSGYSRQGSHVPAKSVQQASGSADGNCYPSNDGGRGTFAAQPTRSSMAQNYLDPSSSNGFEPKVGGARISSGRIQNTSGRENPLFEPHQPSNLNGGKHSTQASRESSRSLQHDYGAVARHYVPIPQAQVENLHNNSSIHPEERQRSHYVQTSRLPVRSVPEYSRSEARHHPHLPRGQVESNELHAVPDGVNAIPSYAAPGLSVRWKGNIQGYQSNMDSYNNGGPMNNNIGYAQPAQPIGPSNGIIAGSAARIQPVMPPMAFSQHIPNPTSSSQRGQVRNTLPDKNLFKSLADGRESGHVASASASSVPPYSTRQDANFRGQIQNHQESKYLATVQQIQPAAVSIPKSTGFGQNNVERGSQYPQNPFTNVLPSSQQSSDSRQNVGPSSASRVNQNKALASVGTHRPQR